MEFRQALLKDIPGMQFVRNAVTENRLSDPGLITARDYEEYICVRGRGWVCVCEGTVSGFSVADLKENNIWALFVLPGYEHRGIGKGLHDRMLEWYFQQTRTTVWLSTAPGTRAERFYTLSGWTVTGVYGKGETRFEMSYAAWTRYRGLHYPD